MNYLPPLRRYQQMVRVVRDKHDQNPAKPATHLTLGNAFGGKLAESMLEEDVSATQIRLRTLETMNLPAGSLRRPGEIKPGGLLPTRTNSSLFHKLNQPIRNYMQGGKTRHPGNRTDAAVGTKFQTQLSPQSPNNRRPHHTPINLHEKHADHRSEQHHPAPHRHQSLVSKH
ncbi:hypothetical protein [Marinomonas sp. THO17]|uniref:hypothetical protein n=1 Tax=Marinomonas sp. THO17 TaxID=3149048 RepID=UPI00336BB1A4